MIKRRSFVSLEAVQHDEFDAETRSQSLSEISPPFATGTVPQPQLPGGDVEPRFGLAGLVRSLKIRHLVVPFSQRWKDQSIQDAGDVIAPHNSGIACGFALTNLLRDRTIFWSSLANVHFAAAGKRDSRRSRKAGILECSGSTEPSILSGTAAGIVSTASP